MRSLFLLLVLGNLALYAYGQGWLGTPPDLQQRTPDYAAQEIRAEAISIRQESAPPSLGNTVSNAQK